MSSFGDGNNKTRIEESLSWIVKAQVEEWMKYLQDNGVLSGHNYGDYIWGLA